MGIMGRWARRSSYGVDGDGENNGDQEELEFNNRDRQRNNREGAKGELTKENISYNGRA